MGRRLAATSALALLALTFAPEARAQGFFSFFEASPREVVERLHDQGYIPHLPMTRRGEVYVVDARLRSGRPVRLVVDVRDGRVLQRYAAAPSPRDDEDSDYAHRAPRRFADADSDDDRPRPSRRLRDDSEPTDRHTTRMALNDPDMPAPRGEDGGVHAKADAAPAASLDKTKAHALKKRHDALAERTAPLPLPTPGALNGTFSAKAVSRPAPTPTPEPAQAKTEAKLSSPEPTPAKVDSKPVAPLPDAAAKPTQAPTSTQAKVEPKPVVSAKPEPVETSAEAKASAPRAEPTKPESSRKKLNDLPVGTLD